MIKFKNGYRAVRDPLKAAIKIPSLNLRKAENLEVSLESPVVGRIERLARFNRVKAAEQADVYLLQSLHLYSKHPGALAFASRLASALGVWATTRSHLGLYLDAEVAMEHAERWIESCPGTGLTGFTLRRAGAVAARIGRSIPTQNEVLGLDRLQAAIYHHIVAGSDDSAIGVVLLEMGRLHLEDGDCRAARLTLRAALVRLGPDSCFGFEAACMVARTYLQEGLSDSAEEALSALEPIGQSQRIDLLQLQADLKQAQNKHDELLELRLELLRELTGSVGAERRLETLLELGRAVENASIPRAVTSNATAIDAAIADLLWQLDDHAWCTNIAGLHQHILSSGITWSIEKWDSQLRGQLAACHRKKAGGSVIETAGMGSLPHSGFSVSLEEETTVGDDDFN